MAQYHHRIGLRDAFIPTDPSKIGNTVIDTRGDTHNSGFIGSEYRKNTGTPSIMYMKNVIPTREGLRAVGYTSKNMIGDYANNDTRKHVSSVALGAGYTLEAWAEPQPINGPVIMVKVRHPDWVEDSNLETITLKYFGTAIQADPEITLSYARISGKIVVCIGTSDGAIHLKGLSIKKFTTFESNDPTELVYWSNLNASNLDLAPNGGPAGSYQRAPVLVSAAANYLILISDNIVNRAPLTITDSVTWSADFTPNATTGAGQDYPSDIWSPARYTLQIEGGFLIYTKDGVITAAETGDPTFPLRYEKMIGVGGIHKNVYPVADPDTGFHYHYDGNNLKALTLQKAENFDPSFSEYLRSIITSTTNTMEASIYDIYSSGKLYQTASFESAEQTAQIGPTLDNNEMLYPISREVSTAAWEDIVDIQKITVFGGRYVGATIRIKHDVEGTILYVNRTYLYDLLLQRVGILEPFHDRYNPNFQAYQYFQYRDIYYCYTTEGKMHKLHTFNAIDEDYAIYEDSMVLLGRYAHSRNHRIELEEIEMENTIFQAIQQDQQAARGVTCKVIPTQDSSNWEPATIPTETVSRVFYKKYKTRVNCRNFMLAFIGAFDLHSVTLHYKLAGRR